MGHTVNIIHGFSLAIKFVPEVYEWDRTLFGFYQGFICSPVCPQKYEICINPIILNCIFPSLMSHFSVMVLKCCCRWAFQYIATLVMGSKVEDCSRRCKGSNAHPWMQPSEIRPWEHKIIQNPSWRSSSTLRLWFWAHPASLRLLQEAELTPSQHQLCTGL